MEAVKIEGNPLPGKIQVDFDGELLVGQSILLNGKNKNIPAPTTEIYRPKPISKRFEKSRTQPGPEFFGHPTRTP